MTQAKILPLLVSIVLLSACGNSKEFTWTEDVKLPDGRVVTLKRWVEFKGGSSHLGDPSTESRQSLEFKHPDTGATVKWQNDQEQGRLKTIAIWVEQGNPFILSEPAYGGDLRKYNCPNPPYLLYAYANGQWSPKPLAQIPFKKIRANMTTHLLEKREEIQSYDRRLTAAQTADSYAQYKGLHRVPYVIQFEGMQLQTFKEEDCSRVSNLKDLIFIEGK
jgi:hypothetical protein